MKIIKTKNFINASRSTGGDFNTQPGLHRPSDINGPIELFRQKSDSKDAIKKKWRRKKIPKVRVKRPYQLDGVPGGLV